MLVNTMPPSEPLPTPMRLRHERQRTIVAWGSHAVQLMTVGSFKEASQAWSCALLQLVPHLQRPEWDDIISEATSSSGELVAQAIDVSCGLVSSDDDRIFSVFPRSFVYVCSDSAQQMWTLEDYRIVAASTVYNLALTHHLQGLQGAGSRRDLNKALQAYGSARELLSLTPSEAAAAPEDLKLLYLAIANNEGHLCEQAFETDRVDVCLNQLHEVLPHTWWIDDFRQFHETAVLFPTQARVSLHAPMA